MEIVSGLGEKPHVTSQQFRQILEGTIGQKSYIITSGENLEPELAANNLLKIRSGMMSHHGNVSSVKIGTYDEVELTNGSQGMKRIDLVVNRYTRNAETNIEKNEWVVIMGTPVASNPVAPAYTVGNLQKGDLVDDCPVFELHYDGINVTEVKKMLSVLPNVAELNSNFKIYSKFITSKPWASVNSDNYETRKYRRSGNLVMLEYLANFNTDGTLSFNLIEQSIPQGYRPVTTVYLPFVQTSGANVIGHGCLRLSPDGTSYMSLTEPGFTEHGGTLMYFTNDPFPKD